LGLIWMAVLCHGTAGAQWLDLDGFMQEQIVTGWWSPQERFLVLQHLDAHGAPHVKEEAWSIEGLSNPSAAQLMASSQWLKLVAESKHSASNGSGGLRPRSAVDGRTSGAIQFESAMAENGVFDASREMGMIS